jgi:acetyl esterase/lipase
MNVVEEMYDRWTKGEGGGDDSWGDITAEPEGVEYREVDAGGVPALCIEPRGARPDRVIVYLHGGGFVSGSLRSHRKLVGHLATAAGTRALLVHYRLTPEFPYPAQIDDGLTAYRCVVDRGVGAVLAGDSSGGGLCVQVALRIRDSALPDPAALMLISPWSDMEASGSTFETNAATDLFFTRDMVKGLVEMYLANGESAADPKVNAHYADLSGLPPMYLQVGGAETGLDDSIRLAERARRAGVEVRLDVFDRMLHTFQMAAGNLDEADDAIGRFGAWLRPRI